MTTSTTTAKAPVTDFNNLHKAQTRLTEALAAADRARDARDAEVTRLNASGVTAYRLAKELGLSQQAIAKIIRKAKV